MMYPYLILNKHYLGKLINDGGGAPCFYKHKQLLASHNYK